jgi:hypothetical protein
MEESTLVRGKKIAKQGIREDSEHAADVLNGRPEPLRKMQGKRQGFR